MAAAVLLFQMAAPMQVFAEAPVEPEEIVAAGEPEDASPEAETEIEAEAETEAEALPGTPTDLPVEELLPAYDLAADADAETEAGSSAFEMAGLNVRGGDELDPTGERENMRPYGKVHVIPSNDFFVFGNTASSATASPPYNIYGVKDPAVPASLADLSLKDQAKTSAPTTKSGTLATAFGARSAVASVAFNPTSAADNHMRQSATAMLAATNADSNENIKGPIVFAVTDRLDKNPANVNVIKEFSYPKDGWSLTNKNIQSELFIEALDLDGDGVDEIAFLLPGAEAGGHSRLVIYKQINTAGDVTSKANWVEIYNADVTGIRMGQSEPSNVCRHRTHSLAVGDLNGDGLDDIAVAGTTTSTFHDTTDAKGDYSVSRLEVLYTTKADAKAGGYTCTRKTYEYESNSTAAEDRTLFGSGSDSLLPLPTPASVGLAKNGSDFSQFDRSNITKNSVKVYPIQLGVAIGDSDGDGENELLLGYNLLGTMTSNGKRFWSNAIAYTVERLVPGKGNTLVRQTSPDGKAIVQTSIADVSRVKDAKLGQYFGPSDWHDQATISAGSFDDNLNGGEYQNEGAVRMAVVQMGGPDAPPSIILNNNRHDAQSIAADQFVLFVTEKTYQHLFPIAQLREKHGLDAEYYTIRPATINTSEGLVYGYITHYLAYNETDKARHDYVEFVTSSTAPYINATRLGKFHRYSPCGVALPCVDSDFVQLEFLEHQYSHTDPTVVAALASQPYYQDLANYYDGYQSDSGSTSYTSYFGTGHGTSESATTSLGAYVSTSAEGGTKYLKAIVEGEVNYNFSFASETEESITRTQALEYAVSGKDSVVVVTYPVDRYIYKMTSYDESHENIITNDYAITVPYPPVTSIVSMAEYNKLYAEYPDALPDIDGKVFTHTQGYPSTYPVNAPAGAFKSSGVNTTSSDSSGNTSASLTIDKSLSRSTLSSHSVGFSVGGGVEAGYEGAVAQAKLTVTATVKLTAKGKLDVSLAQPEPIRVTARLDGYLGTYDAGTSNVKLAIYQKVKGQYNLVYDGTNATPTDINFKVTRAGANSMEWLISPAAGGAIEPGSYRVGVVEGTVAGEQITTLPKGGSPAGNFTAFTVTASKPRATATPASGLLYRSDAGSEQLFRIALPAGSGAISEVKLSGEGTDGMYFDCKDLGGGYVVIHFREPFTTKRGKAIEPTTAAKATTTLTLQVFIEGGSSVKPATSVKVKVAAR
ncbi:VCBS repeat-containing protein [Ruminococcaceae bacterium OttesenSCG-928-D13]|nr:VCBS repeat-containing protein [Ruminococcaceae bacterium OttesenSCG-928-D13]